MITCYLDRLLAITDDAPTRAAEFIAPPRPTGFSEWEWRAAWLLRHWAGDIAELRAAVMALAAGVAPNDVHPTQTHECRGGPFDGHRAAWDVDSQVLRLDDGRVVPLNEYTPQMVWREPSLTVLLHETIDHTDDT